jgi:hypothetical protein
MLPVERHGLASSEVVRTGLAALEIRLRIRLATAMKERLEQWLAM